MQILAEMILRLASRAKKMGCNQATEPASRHSREDGARRPKRKTANPAPDDSGKGGAPIDRDQLPGFAHGHIINLSGPPNDLPVSQYSRACFSLDATNFVGLTLGAARLAS